VRSVSTTSSKPLFELVGCPLGSASEKALAPHPQVLFACADTSKLLWLNIPFACLVVFGLHWLSSLVDIRAKQNGYPSLQKRFNCFSEESSPELPSFTLPVPPTPSNKSGDKWREQVGSPLVEHAWETLCGSIVQEVRLHWSQAKTRQDFVGCSY